MVNGKWPQQYCTKEDLSVAINVWEKLGPIVGLHNEDL